MSYEDNFSVDNICVLSKQLAMLRIQETLLH